MSWGKYTEAIHTSPPANTNIPGKKLWNKAQDTDVSAENKTLHRVHKIKQFVFACLAYLTAWKIWSQSASLFLTYNMMMSRPSWRTYLWLPRNMTSQSGESAVLLFLKSSEELSNTVCSVSKSWSRNGPGSGHHVHCSLLLLVLLSLLLSLLLRLRRRRLLLLLTLSLS